MTAPITPVSESLRSQLGGPVLTVTPGVRGYRIALAGGTYFEVLADGLTLEQADRLREEARP